MRLPTWHTLLRRADGPSVANLFTLLSLAPFLHALPSPAAAPAAPARCNGHAAYCARPYPNVTQVGAHDAPFVGPLPSQNQHRPVGDQLGSGVRFLQGQVHQDDGGLQMCHTSCDLEHAGSLKDFLGGVRGFLDKNPRELVTLLLVNADRAPAADVARALADSGLGKYAFEGPRDDKGVALDAWPTLGAMIKKDQRAVLFLDAGADPAANPALLDEWAHFVETPYGVTSPDAFGGCAVDRPRGATADGRMVLVNHFLDRLLPIGGIRIPDVMAAATTNSRKGIQGQVDACEDAHGRGPKAVLLDYVDVGEGLAWEREANGVA